MSSSSSSAATRDALAKLKPEAAVKELSKKKSNKQCFDCGRSGPQQNVNSTMNTFVCTQCAGIHRKFNHKVKTINMSTFTPAEVEQLANTGNKRARKYWLASLEEGKSYAIDPEDPANVDRFMHMVYVEKRWAKREGSPDVDEDDKKKKDKKAPKDDKSGAGSAPVAKRAGSVSERAFSEATFPSGITVTQSTAAAAAPASKPVAAANDLGLDFLSNLTVSSPVKSNSSASSASSGAAFGFDTPQHNAASAAPSSSGPGLFDEPIASSSNSSAAAAAASAHPAAVSAAVAALRSVQAAHGLTLAQLSAVAQAALAQLGSSNGSAASSPQSVHSAAAVPSPAAAQPQSTSSSSGGGLVDVFADIPVEDDAPDAGGDSGNPFDSDSDDDDAAAVTTRSPASSIGSNVGGGGGGFPGHLPQHQQQMHQQHAQQGGALSPPQFAPGMPAAAAQQQHGALSPQQQQYMMYQQMMYQQQQMMAAQQQQQFGQQAGAFGGGANAFGQQQPAGGGFGQPQQQQQQVTSPTFNVTAAAPAQAQQPAAPAKPDLFAGFASFS